jgi:hypothetical protein
MKRVFWSVIAIAAGAYAIVKLLPEAHLGAGYSTVLSILAALAALAIVIRLVEAQPTQASLREPPALVAAYPQADDGVQVAVGQWRERLHRAQDPDRLRLTITDLVDERLRLAHDVSRAESPQQARELVGPHLWAFLTDQPARPMSPRELAALIARMETL